MCLQLTIEMEASVRSAHIKTASVNVGGFARRTIRISLTIRRFKLLCNEAAELNDKSH